jgi:hypothetical protein
MQCVAQSTPFIGVTVTVLNRRNLRAWLQRLRRRRAGPPRHDRHVPVDRIDLPLSDSPTRLEPSERDLVSTTTAGPST